jgi:Protein of unknown function (DUF4199)
MDFLKTYFSHPLLKWPLLFGLATGLICFAYFLILVALDVPPLGNFKSFDLGFHLILITAAVWYYRSTVGQGRLHLWEGLTIGYIVSMVGAFVTGWLIYGFITQIRPDVFTNYLADSRALVLRGKVDMVKKLGEAQFQSVLAGVGQIKPEDLITDEILKKFILAVLTVLPISLLFRRQDYSILKPE